MTTLTPSRAVAGPRQGVARRLGLPATAAVWVAVVAGVGVLSLVVGARAVPLDALWDADHQLRPVIEARFERTLLGLAVGAALGLAGALMQGLTRNPLADPGILGVNAGATFAMVVGMTCKGCHRNIPPQLAITLQRANSIETCPNCHRIIYSAEAINPPAPSAA